MSRFVKVILCNFHLVIYYVIKMRKINNSKKTNYTKEEKYSLAQKIVNLVSRKGKISVDVYGIENLPKENGYILYPNHQGKYDALAIIRTHEQPVSVVIDKKVCTNPLLNNFLKLTNSKILDKENPRQGIKLFREIEDEVQQGNNFLIFAEGKYEDNHNNLQEFNTGCMRFLYKAKCPIIPVTLFDTYKPFGVNSLKKVSCEVHYLKPIYYEEYENLNKVEIAALIKNRIQEKLDEIKQTKETIN